MPGPPPAHGHTECPFCYAFGITHINWGKCKQFWGSLVQEIMEAAQAGETWALEYLAWGQYLYARAQAEIPPQTIDYTETI